MSGTEASVSFRRGWLRHLQLGLRSAGGAAIVLAIFELLQRQPIAGFGLLSVWGPWPVVVLVGLAIFGRFLSRMNDTIQAAFTAVVSSVQDQTQASSRQADASGRQADALTKLAEQGGQQAEEVRRLAIYAAQEFPSVYERFDRQDAVLEKVTDAVNRLVERG
ncbi:MAG: hypothetical protein P4K93_07475 [Terracidiphilus sp.]|nr:hypothetical protein [Terracidiphilus sp.]